MPIENSNTDTFSNFGKSFQENVASLIVKDKSYSDQIREVLDVTYFEHKYLQIFIKKIFEYKDQYKAHPNNDTIKAILNTSLANENETIQTQIKEFFVKIHGKEVENQEFIKDQSLQFCKKQVVKKAMIESIDLLQKASFDEISNILNDALKKGLDNDMGHDFILDFEERYKIKVRNPVSTGIDVLDQLTKGGPGKGDLCVVVAPSGAGKSFLLVWMGAQALKQGKNVIHYTLELSDKHVGNRYDSCLTGVPLNELHEHKEKIFEKLSRDIQGRLIIKEYPTKSITPRGIRNHLEKLKQRDIPIDLIIVDYPDLLKPLSAYKDKRHELESIFEDMRGIAQYFECPIWTATQTNRGGLDEQVVTMASISEAYAKVFPADFIISLSRTRDDRAANTGRLFVAKNRNGSDNLVFPIFFDPSNVTIKILSESQENIVDESFKQVVESGEKLKNKYKVFRGTI